MPKKDILELADQNGYDHTYEDCKSSSERHVANLLWNQGLYNNLPNEANDVLDNAVEMTKMTFNRRGRFDDEEPKYQIMNWDCGYSISSRHFGKTTAPDKFDEFRKAFKTLADKLAPMVYELGFLK